MAVATTEKVERKAEFKVLPDGRLRVTKTGVLELDLVGTAEAADNVLHVERPRIGRWRKAGLMPPPLGEIAAGPVWDRSQIEATVPERERRRRAPAGAK